MCLDIAGVCFKTTCRDVSVTDEQSVPYAAFTQTRPESSPRVEVLLRVGIPEGLSDLREVFDCQGTWALRSNNATRFIAWHGVRDRPPRWVVELNEGFDRATVHCGRELTRVAPNGTLRLSSPVCYPLDQFLVMYALARRGGMVIHAAGAVFGDRAAVFAGRSGAGKSTLARLLIPDEGAVLLSDDRIVVRCTGEGEWFAHGTPWAGDAGVALNRAAPLAGIFFLRKGERNEIRELSAREAFEALLPVATIPWYDREVLTDVLDSCERLLAAAPARELWFAKDASVAGLVREAMQSV